MKIYKIIIFSFQLYMLLNILSINIIKNYIKKNIEKYNIDNLIMLFKMEEKFKLYIFYGLFMLPFIKKISDEFIYEYLNKTLDRKMEILNIKNKFNTVLNIQDETDTEDIKELKTIIRNYDLRIKVKKLKRRTKIKKLWI